MGVTSDNITHRYSNLHHELEEFDARDVRVHVGAVLDQKFEQRHREVASRWVPMVDLVAQQAQDGFGAALEGVEQEKRSRIGESITSKITNITRRGEVKVAAQDCDRHTHIQLEKAQSRHHGST